MLTGGEVMSQPSVRMGVRAHVKQMDDWHGVMALLGAAMVELTT